ncbi:MAG: hypothetical protein WAV73_06035 [Candidatus Moraniibacteriota bacterium]
MNDFCDCSQCPHHCGGDEEIVSPANKNDDTATTALSDDSDEVSDDEDAKAMAVEKVKKLKKDIKALGFKLKDTDEGIRVTM